MPKLSGVGCILVAALTVALGSCGGESTGPRGLSRSDVNGLWVFTLVANTGCGFSTHSADFVASIYFSRSADGSAGYTASRWSNDPRQPGRYDLSGNIDWGSGQATLKFWRELGDLEFQAVGTFDANGIFEGTAADPIPGNQPDTSVDGCSYDVRGYRTAAAAY